MAFNDILNNVLKTAEFSVGDNLITQLDTQVSTLNDAVDTIYDIKSHVLSVVPDTFDLNNTPEGAGSSVITSMVNTVVNPVNEAVTSFTSITGTISNQSSATIVPAENTASSISSISSISFLPMPQTITATYPKSYENFGTGMIGMMADARKQTLSDMGADIYKAVKHVGAGMINEQAQKVISYTDKMAINDKVKILFKDLPFRTFTLTYALFPKNQGQMNEAFAWIKTVKSKSAPELNGALQAFWTYPDTFDLVVKSSGKTLIKTKPCVVTDFTVDYTPDGIWSQHDDGNPTKIVVSISLLETEPLHRKLIDGDYI